MLKFLTNPFTNINTARMPWSIPNTNTNTHRMRSSIPNTNTNTARRPRSIPNTNTNTGSRVNTSIPIPGIADLWCVVVDCGECARIYTFLPPATLRRIHWVEHMTVMQYIQLVRGKDRKKGSCTNSFALLLSKKSADWSSLSDTTYFVCATQLC